MNNSKGYFGYSDEELYRVSREEQIYQAARFQPPRPSALSSWNQRSGGSSRRRHPREPSPQTRAGYTFAAPFRGRSHKCDDCDASFANVDDLQVHTLTEHHQEDVAAPPPYVGGFHFNAQPVNLESALIATGKFRGIQGENNSCYLDASLMAMFYTNNTFDSLLVRGAGDLGCVNHHQGNEELEYTRMYMTLHIVNQVRQRGFVPSGLVVEWRRMINPWFGRGVDFDSHCEEEEACDFVRFLLENFGNDTVTFVIESSKAAALARQQQPLPCSEIGFEANGELVSEKPRATASANTEVMLQLLAPSHPNGQNGAWTIEQLLTETMRNQDLVFTELQSSLILQLPRYGKRDRVIGDVVPDPVLHVRTSGIHRRKIMYELKAVVVIGTSHFVSYLRVPKGGTRDNAFGRLPGSATNGQAHQEFTWLYYDSMSDRVQERNVPQILDITEELSVLETPNASALVAGQMVRPGRQHLQRVVQDMSMAFYCRVTHYSQDIETTPPTSRLEFQS